MLNSLYLFLETTTVNLRNEVIPEFQIADISDELETCWRQLGPRLKITAAKIKNIDEENKDDWTKANDLLILWKQQEGCNATVGHLADVLEKIGRKRIAEKLLGRLLITLSIYTESIYDRTALVLYRNHVYPFKPQYPPTNSPNWSLHFVYISIENK